MKREEFRQVMLDLFANNSGLDRQKVIFKDQRGDRPAMPYGTIKVISGPKVIGRDEARDALAGEAGDFTIAGQREYLVEFETFSSGDNLNQDLDPDQGALQLMEDFRNSLEKITVKESLFASGVSIHARNDMTDLTDMLEDVFEERANMTIAFGVASNIADSPSTIEEIGITGMAYTDDSVHPVLTTPEQIVTRQGE